MATQILEKEVNLDSRLGEIIWRWKQVLLVPIARIVGLFYLGTAF